MASAAFAHSSEPRAATGGRTKGGYRPLEGEPPTAPSKESGYSGNQVRHRAKPRAFRLGLMVIPPGLCAVSTRPLVSPEPLDARSRQTTSLQPRAPAPSGMDAVVSSIRSSDEPVFLGGVGDLRNVGPPPIPPLAGIGSSKRERAEEAPCAPSQDDLRLATGQEVERHPPRAVSHRAHARGPA